MTLAQRIADFRRGAHLRFHVYVYATKVWNVERQAYDYLMADEQYPELVSGHATLAEARTERDGLERADEESKRDGFGAPPDLVFYVRDTGSQ